MCETRIIEHTDIKYLLDKGKRKNSYIQIKKGQVIVKVPRLATQKYIDDLLKEKLEWIEKKLEQNEKAEHKPEYKNESKIFVLGKKLILKIKYLPGIKRIKLENTGSEIVIYFPNEYGKLSEEDREAKTKKIIEGYYKAIAKEEVMPAMEDLQKRTGLYPVECNIKNLKATWGICSSKRKISINQNLMAYSRQAIEYVCLHELCHLKYMNHSKEFWNLVEYYMPNYKQAKQELCG